jgi:hypothetical protein
LSILENSEIAFSAKLFLPVMFHVTTLPVPSGFIPSEMALDEAYGRVNAS